MAISLFDKEAYLEIFPFLDDLEGLLNSDLWSKMARVEIRPLSNDVLGMKSVEVRDSKSLLIESTRVFSVHRGLSNGETSFLNELIAEKQRKEDNGQIKCPSEVFTIGEWLFRIQIEPSHIVTLEIQKNENLEFFYNLTIYIAGNFDYRDYFRQRIQDEKDRILEEIKAGG